MTTRAYGLVEKGPPGDRDYGLFVNVSVSGKETVTGVIPGLYNRAAWKEPYTLYYYANGPFEEVRAFRGTLILDRARRWELPVDPRTARTRKAGWPEGHNQYSMEPLTLPFQWTDFEELVLETELTVVEQGRPRTYRMAHRLSKEHTWTIGPRCFFEMMSV